MNATNVLPDNNGRVLVLATVLALSMVALAAAFSGGAAASQHDVDVSFNNTEGDVGDQVAVSFDIDPANAPNAEVGAYDVEINYDETVLSFVEMNGVDLADPVVNEPSPGTITANVGQATGDPVPLTAANVVFQVDQGVPDGEVANISLDDANSQFNDPINPVTFESQNGSVTVGATDSDYQLSNLVPQDATVTQGGDPITVSADVTNEGTEAGDQTVVLEVSNQSGVVFSDSQSGIQVGPGETQTVSFQGVPAGTLDLGDYTHSISTNDDSISGSLTVQEEPDFVVGPGLDIQITDGLTIGDDYPLNFNSLGGDVYGPTSPINTPTAVDERYAPFIQGQHVGITGLPVQTDTYEWVADQGLLGSSTASQTVETSFDASVGSVSLGYSQSVAHGLAPAGLQVAEVAGIDAADLNLDIGASGVDITYDPADATADDIQVRFNIEWEAANSVEGLDVDANNNIDFGTAHRLQQGDERVSDTFVTFETGTTGISNNDAVAPSNFDNEFPDAALEGPVAFQVRQNQLVTFEVADNEDALAVYEYQTDNDGNVVLEDGNQVDPNQISFDQTEPGQVANLNTGDLSPGDYVVEFQNSGQVVGLQVLELNLGADTPADTQRGEFVSLPVSADSSAEGNDVEAYFYEAGTSGIGNVIHVERDQLGGDGDALLDDVSTTADLNAAVGDEFYAIVRHLDSGVTTQTGTFEVVDRTPDLIPADDVNIVSPSLESPNVPGQFDRGDVIPIELELEGGNVATITFGDAEEQNVEVTATVYDPTFSEGQGDTTINLFLSTYHIGHGFVADGSIDNLVLNTPPWSTAGVADNRNHGFIAAPDDPTSALLPAERLDREANVFAEGSIDIYGGSQGGAVLSPDPGYDLHATGGDLPYTLIGDDRDDERDDVNFLTVDDRSTQDFRFWTAPGEGDAAINIGPEATAEDIEDLVSQGLISELETETVTETAEQPLTFDPGVGQFVPAGPGDPISVNEGEQFQRTVFNDQVAEGDFLIVQAQATGLEGPLIEAELRQNPSDANIQDLIETVTGAADDGVITNAFLNATSEMVPDSEPADEPNNRLLDYGFDLFEDPESYQQRISEPEPNEGLVTPDPIDPATGDVSTVVAGLNADNTPSTFYIPYKVGEDLPVQTGANTETENLTFNADAVLEPRGGTQPSVPDSVNPLLSAASVGTQFVEELDYVQAQVSIDSQHTGPSGLEVPRVDNYTITGTSTMASGTTVDVVLLSETDEATPFLKTAEGVELTAQDDSPLSAWEATFDFSETRDNVEIVGGTMFEVDITRAGAGNVAGGENISGVVLNDPAIETFTLNNQRSDGDVVTIAAYEANRVSQITIQDADGNVIGTSDVLPRGQLQEQFNIELDQALNSNQQVTAVAEIVQPEAGDELASETATINIEDQSEAFFSVSDLVPQDATVEDGAVIDVSATVENIGDLEATQEVTLEIGEVPLVQELTLNGSESETVTFPDINVSAVGPGDYTHTFSTEDASTSGSLTVQEPPAPAVFEIISVSPEEATATQGDTVTVSATVQNTGDQEATGTVNLDIDGISDSSDLTLAGGETGSVSFDVDTSGVDAGDYTHTVSTEDDEFSGSLTIENVTMDNNESEDDGDGSGAGFGVAIAALALLGAALLAARRKAE